MQDLGRRAEAIDELGQMLQAETEPDADMVAELETDLSTLQADLDRVEVETLLCGDYDDRSAIVEVNAGAGGTESCDWAQMLLRMLLRWAQDQGYNVEMVDELPGDVAGIKSATFQVSGKRFAYGYLKSERGVHRLVRISPFDAAKRRHTSFASIDVLPEVTDTDHVDIPPDDIRVDTYRSSGAGGQHVNKTDSAVRITHLPTGIVVSCQNERSQHKNRASAMKVLQSRLLEVERRKRDAERAEIRGVQQAIEWGSQIRSYVFQPYTMVKDHRTGAETGDVMGVMDGAISRFMGAYLRWPERRE